MKTAQMTALVAVLFFVALRLGAAERGDGEPEAGGHGDHGRQSLYHLVDRRP